MRPERSPSDVVPPALTSYLDGVVGRLRDRLGDRLVGVYLHGSAAMEAFVPTRSDVDVLVVATGPLPAAIKRGIADDLSSGALPCPGVGLELAVVNVDSLEHPSDAPAFELQLDMHEGHADRVIDGVGRDGDPDLVAHYAMTRAHGIPLVGPPPHTLFPSVERERLLRTLADDLAWGLEHGHTGYAVLNACRALRLAREGVLCSKPEGGRWAVEHRISEPETIEAALRRQAGSDEEVDPARAAAFVADVRRELAT